MTRLEVLEETFHAALECKPDQVSVFLDTHCAGDDTLRVQIEELLASHQRAGTSVETSIAAVAASVIQDSDCKSLVGRRIGHYQILKRIGAGGMGKVYLASDLTAGRKAALKLLPGYLAADHQRLSRFEQEAHTIAGLNHPNIMTIYEVGAHDRVRYIAGELIEGETLRQRLARGRIELLEAIEIAIQVATALAAAHSAGAIHRDIKPENIMLRADGYVKVLDFGIAKLVEQELPGTFPRDEPISLVETNAGSILGTVSYMSPEQARGEAVDQRSDIWSLGAVLYEMTAGRPPFTGETARAIITAILEKEPSPLIQDNIPADLQRIVSKSLRKAPEQRYQSANEMLDALKALRHKMEFAAEFKETAPRYRWMRSSVAVTLAVLVTAMAIGASFFWWRNGSWRRAPAKSIAVLPFANLTADKQDSFLADGLQDEILSDLAKVADLKVISRTSAVQYKSSAPARRNLRQIGQELGVANLVEGSVQRSGNRVHVNAQLIDARTDSHLWGNSYDRELSDVFAIQNEIAKAIAAELRVKLSPAEQKAMERVPTKDVRAFDLYSQAKNLLLTTTFSSDAKADLHQSAELLNQAVARDPSFFQAYCALAYAHDTLYFNHEHTAAQLALADAAIQAALRLEPDAAEIHVAQAWHRYSGYLDYDGALTELERAGRKLPNDSRVFQLSGFIQRRQGHWDHSTRNLERAISLDPRNVYTLQQIALSYDYQRRYADEEAIFDRVLMIKPDDIDTKMARACAEVYWHADTRPLRSMIDSIRSTNPAAMSRISDAWLLCALSERDADSVREALLYAEERPHVSSDNVALSRLFLQGVAGRMTNNAAQAQSAFTSARAEQEKTVQAQPGYGPALCLLGLIDAGLGRKEEALSEGRHAVALLPVEKDAINGPAMIKYLAVIAAWTGEKDLACEQLETALRFPSCLSYGHLKLLPFWDPLRGDPRFEQIVASLAPTQ